MHSGHVRKVPGCGQGHLYLVSSHIVCIILPSESVLTDHRGQPMIHKINFLDTVPSV